MQVQTGKTVAIIQARLASVRLPRKMLRELRGRPVIAWTTRRVAMAERVDQVVVATTDLPEDDPLAAWCDENGVQVFRGSSDDVLDRFYQCARAMGAGYVVRVTGDCPLTDPAAVDSVCALLADSPEADYAANCEPPVQPEGMAVEALPFRTLDTAWRESTLPSHREHVTPYVRFNPERFAHVLLPAERNLSHMRVTVDYEQDIEGLNLLLERLDERGVGEGFALGDVVAVWEEDHGVRELLGGPQPDLWRESVLKEQASETPPQR